MLNTDGNLGKQQQPQQTLTPGKKIALDRYGLDFFRVCGVEFSGVACFSRFGFRAAQTLPLWTTLLPDTPSSWAQAGFFFAD
jgi:hypothetical protein